MTSRDIYEQTFDEDVQQHDQKTCPECSGRVTTNVHETVCEDCGLVLEDEQIDHGPEWREFDDGCSCNRRAGTPNTVARHDRGIGTGIGRDRDSKGRQLTQRKQRELFRLRRGHKHRFWPSESIRTRFRSNPEGNFYCKPDLLYLD